MSGYYFQPAMPLYGSIILAPTKFLMSDSGRKKIADSIRTMRKRWGKTHAKLFRNALIHAGAIYPQDPFNRPIVRKFSNLAEMVDCDLQDWYKHQAEDVG